MRGTDRARDRESRPRSAAICYRRSPGGLEFLLVKTKGRRGWTFPKGHVEAGETPQSAAEREAREEAGARGRVDPRPLLTYRYPSSKPGTDGQVEVAAYLMEVDPEGSGGHHEWFRQPAWFRPADAVARLSENREEEFAAEHRRVVEAAVERLTQNGTR